MASTGHGDATPVRYQVKVTNTGDVDSDEVVLGFLRPPGAGMNGVPLQQLFGFERVYLKAGASQLVNLYPEMHDFSQVDRQGQRYELSGDYTVAFGVKESGGYAEHSFTAV